MYGPRLRRVEVGTAKGAEDEQEEVEEEKGPIPFLQNSHGCDYEGDVEVGLP